MEHLWSPWRMTYIENSNPIDECIFCKALSMDDGVNNLILHRGQFAFIMLNRYPYTSGHLMVVPNQHLANLWELDVQTRSEIMELTSQSIQVLRAEYHMEGVNLGMNVGEVAGAGIADHIHMHIVPRWKGDTNFMSTTAQTRVLPESLEETLERLSRTWRKMF